MRKSLGRARYFLMPPSKRPLIPGKTDDWKGRSTSELMLTLGQDVLTSHAHVIAALDQQEAAAKQTRHKQRKAKAAFEFAARQLIRAIFAYIEATMFSARAKAMARGIKKRVSFSESERFFALEIRAKLDNDGKVVERTANINLARNLRYTFAVIERAHRLRRTRFDASAPWWSSLQTSIKVRDRITHPRIPNDVDISTTEVAEALRAYKGFTQLLLSYPPKASKKTRQKLQPPDPVTNPSQPTALPQPSENSTPADQAIV